MTRDKPIRIVASSNLDKIVYDDGKKVHYCQTLGQKLKGSNTIILYALHWANEPAFEDFHVSRHEPLASLRDVNSTAGTLFHELVHLVSQLCFEDFINVSGSAARIFRDLPNTVRVQPQPLIMDVWMDEVALPKSFTDGVILRHWRTGAAYGTESCTWLAQLDRGAVGALANADSFTCFVAHNAHAYLSAVSDSQPDADLVAADKELSEIISIRCFDIWKRENRR